MSARPVRTIGSATITARPGRSLSSSQAASGTITTWLLAINVARPVPMYAIDDCQTTTSIARNTPDRSPIIRSLVGLESLSLIRHHSASRTGSAYTIRKPVAVSGSAPDSSKKIALNEMMTAPMRPAQAGDRVVDASA